MDAQRLTTDFTPPSHGSILTRPQNRDISHPADLR